MSTDTFNQWLRKLKNPLAKKAMALRLARAEAGNLGDVKALGDELSEMRIFTGKGYRVYFTEHQGELIILLAGGDKSSQSRDIEKARELLKELNNETNGV